MKVHFLYRSNEMCQQAVKIKLAHAVFQTNTKIGFLCQRKTHSCTCIEQQWKAASSDRTRPRFLVFELTLTTINIFEVLKCEILAAFFTCSFFLRYFRSNTYSPESKAISSLFIWMLPFATQRRKFQFTSVTCYWISTNKRHP